MFYNINTSCVEDLTKQGMQDLDGCLIRTPLQPLTTFLDDPLRVLRAVRFASRYNFALDADLEVGRREWEIYIEGERRGERKEI